MLIDFNQVEDLTCAYPRYMLFCVAEERGV